MKKLYAILAILMVCILLFIGCGKTATPTTSAPQPTTSAPQPTTSAPQPTTSAPQPTTSAPHPTTTAASVARSVLKGPQPKMPDLAATPQYGGTMKMIYHFSVANMGAPWKVLTGPNKMAARFALEALTGEDPSGNPTPQLATSWDKNPALKTIVFTLREGVKFHDGTDFNAGAVKWNLDKSIASRNPSVATVSSVDVIDPYHVRLNCSKWDPDILSAMSAECSGVMVSPTAAQKLIDAGKEADIPKYPVGTGPFVCTSFTPGVFGKFEKFDGYWQKGLPYLDAVQFDVVSDYVTAFASFLSGECQFLEGIQASQVKQVQAAGGYPHQNFMVSGLLGFTFDSKNTSSPFNKTEVRQAVAYACNIPTAVTGAWSGMYNSTNQFSAPGYSSYDPTIVGYPYNTAKAAELLTLAGYGTANPISCKLTYSQDPLYTDFYTAIQADLSKVGVKITLNPITSTAWNSFRAQPFPEHPQMSDWSLSFQLSFPYSTSLSQTLNKGAQWSPDTLIPDDFEALYQTMLAETDIAKREAYYKALNKMGIDKYCLAVPTYLRSNYKGIGKTLHDMGQGEMSGEYLPEIIWLSK